MSADPRGCRGRGMRVSAAVAASAEPARATSARTPAPRLRRWPAAVEAAGLAFCSTLVRSWDWFAGTRSAVWACSRGSGVPGHALRDPRARVANAQPEGVPYAGHLAINDGLRLFRASDNEKEFPALPGVVRRPLGGSAGNSSLNHWAIDAVYRLPTRKRTRETTGARVSGKCCARPIPGEPPL